jgi:hypothetical protein
MAVGTIQMALIAAEIDGSVLLPEPPFGLSMTVEGEGGSVEYEFVDPDPGHFSKTSDDGDVLISITIRTFAVPLEPGSYTITDIRIHSDVFSDAPRSLPLIPSGDGKAGAVQPHFTVVENEPCTFVGEITALNTRLPPGDAVEIVRMAQEYAEGAPVNFTMDTEGPLMSGQIGLHLLDEIIEGDLSGHSWWLDGEQVDSARCVTHEAQFDAEALPVEADVDEPADLARSPDADDYNLSVGECIDEEQVESYLMHDDYSTASCDEPHDNEVFFIYEWPEGPFPGDDAVGDELYSMCLDEFERYVGTDYDTSTLDFWVIFPDQTSWKYGERFGECLLYDMDETKLTGPAQNSGW